MFDVEAASFLYLAGGRKGWALCKQDVGVTITIHVKSSEQAVKAEQGIGGLTKPLEVRVELRVSTCEVRKWLTKVKIDTSTP